MLLSHVIGDHFLLRMTYIMFNSYIELLGKLYCSSLIWQLLKPLVMSKFNFYVYPQISSAEIFLIGAIAKAIATTATYPLQTVQAILRVNANKL